MRHYASIPFGGKNITDDIKSECQISERLAENIKMAFGACMPDKLQSLSEKIIHIRSNSTEPDKQLPVKYLSEIITARVEEIMTAILYEIQESGFADMLRSGIVVTGGSAQIPNLGSFINDLSGFRVRTGYPRRFFSCQGCDGLGETTASTSIGLILAANELPELNCAFSKDEPAQEIPSTSESNPDGNLFSDQVMEDVKVKETKEKEPRPQKVQKPKVTWGKSISDFVGGIFDTVMNDMDSEN
jgi:cell division protein FtsA